MKPIKIFVLLETPLDDPTPIAILEKMREK